LLLNLALVLLSLVQGLLFVFGIVEFLDELILVVFMQKQGAPGTNCLGTHSPLLFSANALSLCSTSARERTRRINCI
jgi:hypothetical protein